MHRFVPPARVRAFEYRFAVEACVSERLAAERCVSRPLNDSGRESVVVVSVRVLGDMICLLYAQRRYKTGGRSVVVV